MAEIPFALIFAKISGENRSGVLSLADTETKEIRKRIGFKSGRSAYVSGGTINETMGRLLVKWGNITQEQYEKCLAFQKQHDKRAGEALVMMKILTPQQLGEALQRQTEEKILTCFGMEDATYSFIEVEPPADKQLLFFKISPEKILLEGIRNYMPPAVVAKLLSPLKNSKMRRTPEFDSKRDLFVFAPKEARILHAVRNGVSISEILNQFGQDGQGAMKIVYLLLAAGLIEPEDTVAISSESGYQSKPPMPPPQGEQSAPAQAATPPHPPTPSPPTPSEPRKESVAQAPAAPTMVIEEEEEEASKESSSPGIQFEIEGEAGVAFAKAQAPKKQPTGPAAPPPPKSKQELDHLTQIKAEIEKYQQMCSSGTYFDLLSVDRNASASDIKKSYFRLAKKFHPDTNPDFFKGEFKEKAEEIFTHIGTAYNTLIDQKAREEYIYAQDHQISQEDMDKANRALEAEGIFIKAEVMFKKGDFRGAQTMIEQAIKLNPEEPEYYVYLGWALYKASRGLGLADARKNIEKALKMGLREKLDMAHYYLGMFAKVENRPVPEQEKHFAAAVEANSQNTLAQSELRHLRMRKDQPALEAKQDKDEKKKGGFFGRFKK